MNHTIYLALGGNLGDRESNMKAAIKSLESYAGSEAVCSPMYETKPVGFDSDNLFLNCVVRFITDKTPMDWLDFTQKLEKELGRSSKSINLIYKDRPIDIDIVIYDDLVLDIAEPKQLTIPHPRMCQRAFVLLPLRDIAMDLVVPGTGKTVEQLASLLPKEEVQGIYQVNS